MLFPFIYIVKVNKSAYIKTASPLSGNTASLHNSEKSIIVDQQPEIQQQMIIEQMNVHSRQNNIKVHSWDRRHRMV